MPQIFALPDGIDHVKLPSAEWAGSNQFFSRTLPIPFAELRDLRRDMLLSLVRHFQPDMVIVDTFPTGLDGEIVPALRYLKETSTRTRLVLGLRDIVGEASQIREVWARDGSYELLDDLYELILVYGKQEVYDVIAEYAFSSGAAAKTRYSGYLHREIGDRSAQQIRAGLGLRTDRLVLVTAGGGHDGYALCRAVLEALRSEPGAARFDWLVVGGPLMPAEYQATLREMISADSTGRFLEFVLDLADYIAAADVVVSMGGYNSVCEILSRRKPAIVVPRVTLTKDQLVRAEIMSRLGLLRMIHPDDLSPGRLVDEVNQLLVHPDQVQRPLALDGLSSVVAELEAVIRRSR